MRNRVIMADKTAVVWVVLMLSGTASPAACLAQSRQDGPALGQSKPDQACPGRDRWLVKTASDPGAGKVKQKPVVSTIEKLLALQRPADMPLDATPEKYENKRAEPIEETIYSVEADIVEFRLMPDGDYRVVLRGASGASIVMEMPDPDPRFVDPKSPFAYAIKNARTQFEAKAKPVKAARPLDLHAKITGIGFYGRAFRKNQAVKGNLIQLHPVLNVEWMDKSSVPFAQEASKRTPQEPKPQDKPAAPPNSKE